MPIRINLLAEQQAAVEARRRDPVKRSLWGGGLTIGLVVLWCVFKQISISGARSELATLADDLKQLQPSMLESSNTLQTLADVQGRLDSLEKHTTNRFLWANILNAFQQASNRNVRVVSIDGRSESTVLNQIIKETKIEVNLPPSSWLPWGSKAFLRNIPEEAGVAMEAITNGTELARYHSALTTALTITTNRIKIFGQRAFSQIVAKAEVVKPKTVTENVLLTIRARDYSSPYGSRVDPFFAGITNLHVFRAFPSETNSSVQQESIQPMDDLSDLIDPTGVFIPVTVKLHFPERIRANE